MKELILKNKKILKEMFMYGIIGVFSSFIDYGVFAYLRNHVPNVYLANFISMNVGMVCSFFLNTFFNFKMTDKLLKRAVKFCLVCYCGMALSMVIMFLGCNVLNFDSRLVKIVSIIIVAACQFVMNKLITFRSQSVTESQK